MHGNGYVTVIMYFMITRGAGGRKALPYILVFWDMALYNLGTWLPVFLLNTIPPYSEIYLENVWPQ